MSSRRSAKDRRIDELLANLKSNDRLLVSELSRLGRSTGEVIQLIKTLTDQKIEFVAVKQGFRIDSQNNKDMTSKVMVTIFSLLAELERDLISERTKMGLARARASGKKLGRTSFSSTDGSSEEWISEDRVCGHGKSTRITLNATNASMSL